MYNTKRVQGKDLKIGDSVLYWFGVMEITEFIPYSGKLHYHKIAKTNSHKSFGKGFRDFCVDENDYYDVLT